MGYNTSKSEAQPWDIQAATVSPLYVNIEDKFS